MKISMRVFRWSVSTGDPEACLKNHSCSLHASLCAEFCPHSADAALIQTKSSTNCDVHLTESIFQRALGSAEHFVSNVLQRRLRDDGGSKGNDLPSFDRIQGFENAGDSFISHSGVADADLLQGF